jgi:PAS domain S-box-containing protein
MHPPRDVEALQGRIRELEDQLRRRPAPAGEAVQGELQRIIDLLPVMIFAKDREGRFLLANQAVADSYGLTVADILGRRHDEIHPDPAEVARMLADDRRVIQSQTPVYITEESFRDAQQRTRYLQTYKIPYQPPHSPLPAVLGIAQEITDRRQAEEALREREASLRAILRAAPTGIGTVVHRVIQEANDRLCDMLGYTREELLGQSARMLYPTEEDFAFVGREKYRQIGLQGSGTVETHWRHKDGRVMDVLLSSTPLDPTDWSRGVTFTALDITERKRMEAALREGEQRMRAVFEATPDPLVVYNHERHPVFINPAFTQVFGWRLDELAGRQIPFVAPGEEEVTARKIAELYRERRPVRFESRRLTRDGAVRDVIVSAAIIQGPGEQTALGMVVNLADVTERKAFEMQLQQARKIEAIGLLAGGVAHDFNNMLSPILGYAELLLEDLHPGDARYGQVAEIKKAAERSRNLVRQLLLFSRQQPMDLKIVDVRQIVGGLEKMLRRILREHIHLTCTAGPEPCLIQADLGQVEQILINLAVNAQDAMPDGGRLNVRTGRCRLDEDFCRRQAGAAPGDYVALAVADTGRGMDAETQRKIFDPFFTTKGPRGTGLGLATVYGIVRQHGGIIATASEPGRGATFTIYFPEAQGKAQAVEESAPPAANLQGTETVLVVEDNEMVRHLARQVLERQGYTVLTAACGTEALEVIAAGRPPDLLLTDMVMPDMSGRELYDAVVRRFPGVKALFMSGYSDELFDGGGPAMPPQRYLQKPFAVNALAAAVREALTQP